MKDGGRLSLKELQKLKPEMFPGAASFSSTLVGQMVVVFNA